jgi:hypothetical protein
VSPRAEVKSWLRRIEASDGVGFKIAHVNPPQKQKVASETSPLGTPTGEELLGQLIENAVKLKADISANLLAQIQNGTLFCDPQPTICKIQIHP